MDLWKWESILVPDFVASNGRVLLAILLLFSLSLLVIKANIVDLAKVIITFICKNVN